MPSEMERFAARSAERFPFLHPSKLRDGAGVRPGQPGYNPRTLLLPPGWFKAQKVDLPCCGCVSFDLLSFTVCLQRQGLRCFRGVSSDVLAR